MGGEVKKVFFFWFLNFLFFSFSPPFKIFLLVTEQIFFRTFVLGKKHLLLRRFFFYFVRPVGQKKNKKGKNGREGPHTVEPQGDRRR